MLTERPTDRSLNLMPIAPDPICPACGSPIVSGSVVFYNDDHLTHIDCHNGILTDAADKIVAVLARHPGAALDRKSTRLNSSHDYISYAVFCLNKKITNRPGHPCPCPENRPASGVLRCA